MPSVLQIVFSTVAACLGIVFNGYILFVLLLNRKIQNANRVLLLHMAFVDTIFCLVILLYNTTLSAAASASGDVPYNLGPLPMDVPPTPAASLYGFCAAHGFMWTLLPVVVVWTICGLSCDRYAAISTPLHYSRVVNTRRAFVFVIASWLAGATLATPPLLGVCPYTFWDSRWACAATCTTATNTDLGYAVTYVVLAIVLPVAIILVCNIHILIIAKYHRHRIMSAIYEVTLKAQATVTHQRNPCYLSKFKGRSAFFTISQVVGTLVILTVPYYSVLVWEAAHGKAGNAIFVSITTILLTCIPPVNAYVYGVKSRVLRQTLKRLLYRHLYPEEYEGMSRRFSEIFADPRRPPLLRRVSAPAGYCRKISGSLNHSQFLATSPGCSSSSEGRPNARNPFMRSSSLPTSNNPCCAVSFDFASQKIDQITSERKSDNPATTSQEDVSCHPRKYGRILPRGASFPPCEVTELESVMEENDARKVCLRHNKKMMFGRSSSLPETPQTLKEADEVFSPKTCNSLTAFIEQDVENKNSVCIRKENASSSMSFTNRQSTTLLVSDL